MHPTFPQGAGAQTFRLKGVKNFADVLCTVHASIIIHGVF